MEKYHHWDDKRPSLHKINLNFHLSGLFSSHCHPILEVQRNAKLHNLGIILNHFIILLITNGGISTVFFCCKTFDNFSVAMNHPEDFWGD